MLTTLDDQQQRQQPPNPHPPQPNPNPNPNPQLLPRLPSSDVAMLKTKNLNKLLQQNTSPHITSAIIFTPAGSLLASSHSPTSPKTLRTQTTLAANIWCAYAAAHLPPSVLTTTTTTSSSEPSSTQPPPAQQIQQQPQISSLTLELSSSNLHITQIRPRLLLCLIGPSSVSPLASSAGSLASPTTTQTGAGGAGGGGVGTRPTSSSAASTPPGVVAGPGGSIAGTMGLGMTPAAGAAGAVGEGDAATTGSSSRGSSTGKQRGSHSQSQHHPHPGVGVGGEGGEISALGILRTQAEGLARWLEGELEGFDMPDMM